MKWPSWQALDEVLKGCFWSIPITITFCDLVGTVSKVEGHSMSPTVNPKSVTVTVFLFIFDSDIRSGTTVDLVWIDRLSLLFKSVQRGEVVVLA